jgi:iron(III) transport system substrate-binding protein
MNLKLCRLVIAGTSLLLTTSASFAADQALIDAARKEGSVTWYTTQIINQFAAPAAEAFQKKYNIRVDYVRADNNEVILRLGQESKAGKIMGDVFDGTVSSPLIRDGLVLQYQPESVKDLPQDYRDPNGYWVATNLYVHTPGINTALVPKGQEPKTHMDFLDPKWKGKLVWAGRQASSAAPGFIGAVLMEMGEEKGKDFLRQLAKQNVTALGVSARQVLDQVIAGEFAVALNIFNNHATISAAQGAPSAWLPISPSLAVFSVAGVVKNGPHPNAGKLLIDFLISEDGQKIYRDADYISVHPKVPPRDPNLRPDGEKFKAFFVGPDELEDKVAGWWKVYQEIFR